MTSRTALCLAGTAIALSLLLSGCGLFNSTREGQSVRTYQEAGLQGGVPFSRSGREETHHSDSATVGIDPALIGAAAVAVGSGGTSLIAQVVMGLTSAGGIGAIGLLLKTLSGQAAAHKADADEAWQRLIDAPAQAAPKTAA